MKQDQNNSNQQASNFVSHQNNTLNNIIFSIEAFLRQSNQNANRCFIQSQQPGNIVPVQTQSQYLPFFQINPFNTPLLFIPYNAQTGNFLMFSNVNNNNIINNNIMSSSHYFDKSNNENSAAPETACQSVSDVDSDTSESEVDSDTDAEPEDSKETITDSVEDRNDRLAFAIAVKTYNEKNETNIINEILQNCFDFLPLETIKVIKLANKECCSVMNELLKQSMRAVIIGSRPKEIPLPKNKRSFYLEFNDEGKNQDTEKTIKHKIDFITTTMLNTTFIFFEIHMYKFSPKFLEKVLKAFSNPTVCTQLKSVMCLISRVNSHKPISNFINSLLNLSQKIPKGNFIDYTFTFNPDYYKRAYAKTVEKQLKQITFPQNKNYSLNLDFGSEYSLKNIPGTKQFISQPDTQKKINTSLCTDKNINDFITNIYAKIPQKNATEVEINGKKLFQEASIVNLTKTFFDEKLYPSLEKLHLYDCKNFNINHSHQQENNNAIKNITIKDSKLPISFVVFLLNSCKNLKTLIIDNSRIEELSNNFLTNSSIFLLENFTLKTDEYMFFSDSFSTQFFSIQSLKQMLTRFPYLKTLSLYNIMLDYINGNNEADQFISFVQNIAYCIPNIFFRVTFTDALQQQLTTHIEQFKKDIANLKRTLETKHYDVSISLSEHLRSLSININKK